MPHYKFDQIAYNITDKKMPAPGDEKTYIGLEHLDSGNLRITRWGSEVELKGQKLVMKKGDVLFGRRNTYLRRAAISPHDGIFSAHGMIFRPKTEVIDPEYFPFFISSNYFMDAAIRISVGSLSPTVNWKTLKELEFDIPTLEEQRKSAELLKAVNATKEAYQELLIKTDDLVKSQFIEMFASTPKGKLEDVAFITMGQSPSGKSYNENGKGTPFYQGKTEFGDLYIGDAVTWTTEPTRFAEANDVLMSVRAPVGSTNIATQTCCLGRGLAGLRPIAGKSTTMFILYSMRSIEEEIDSMGVGSTFKAINKKQVHELPIPLADIQHQDRFVELAEQSDKSKFELQQAIESTDKLIKSILYSDLEDEEGRINDTI